MSMTKKITPLVAFGGMVLGLGMMEQEVKADSATLKGTVTASSLNVRSSGSTSSKIVGKVSKGAQVTISEVGNGWYKIKSGNVEGWVSSSYIKMTAVQGKTTANLNVRSSNSTSSSVLKTLSKGTSVTITEAKNGWYKVTSGSTTGWVSTQYVDLTSSNSSNNSSETKQGKTTANLNVRSSNSASASIVKTLSKGTNLTITEEKNGWYKITSGSTTGWVSTKYVDLTSSSSDANPSDESDESSNNTSDATLRYGQTTANLNVRAGNSTSSSILTTLSKGASVTILEEKDGWYKVSSGSTTGWVSAQYVEVTGKLGETTANLNVRKSNSTSAAIVTTLPSGTSVTITEEKDGWYNIIAGNTTGWVSAQYIKLVTSDDQNSNTDTDADAGVQTELGQTTANLNMRENNSTSSPVIKVLAKGTSFTIIEEKDDWYKIVAGDDTGWVSKKYVEKITGSATSGSDTWGILSRYSIPGVSASNATKYLDIITSVSNQHGVPVALIQKVIEAESNFNNQAQSPVGAQGLMQLMPATAAWLGVTDSFDSQQNIEAGVRYIKQHLNTYKGDLILTLAAYNAGSGNVNKYNGVPPFKETINYIKKITGVDVSAGYSKP